MEITREDIKKDTEVLVHELEVNPTNADIIKKFEEHALDDIAFQDKTMLIHAAQAESSADMEGKLASLEAKIDGLATKDDIEQQTASIKEAVLLSNRIKIGEAAVKYSIKNAPNWLAGLTIILGIYLFFKVGIAGVLAFIFGNKL